jgi:cellulose biosynthesis protein BcsQ
MKKIIYLSLMIILLSCKTEKKEKEFIDSPIFNDTDVVIIDPPPSIIKLDTIDIDNFNVLFFKPNESEYNALLKTLGENSGINEVDSDFGFYTNKVYDSISKTDLKVKIVTERIIKYSTKSGIKFLDRLKNEKGQYGVIFNQPNCEPRIEFGVMTDVGIFRKLAEYNKNCK